MKKVLALMLVLAAPTLVLAQTITESELSKAQDNLSMIAKVAPVKDAVADDLSWLKVTFSTDKSGEGRVGSQTIDGAHVTLVPADPEFATVLTAVKAAAARKVKAAGDEIKAMGLTIEEPTASK